MARFLVQLTCARAVPIAWTEVNVLRPVWGPGLRFDLSDGRVVSVCAAVSGHDADAAGLGAFRHARRLWGESGRGALTMLTLTSRRIRFPVRTTRLTADR